MPHRYAIVNGKHIEFDNIKKGMIVHVFEPFGVKEGTYYAKTGIHKCGNGSYEGFRVIKYKINCKLCVHNSNICKSENNLGKEESKILNKNRDCINFCLKEKRNKDGISV